ncbi:MAG: coproporphyrinogen dehydrogenase HemZ [Carboxydocellales bacterium]
MKVYLDCQENLIRACQDMVRVFFSDIYFTAAPEGADFILCFQTVRDEENIIVEGSLDTSQSGQQGKDKLTIRAVDKQYPDELSHNAYKRVAKLAVMGLLERYTAKSAGPWGILTGIRPTKIAHRKLDLDWTGEQLAQFLQTSFALRRDKSLLLSQVANLQRNFLHPQTQAGKFVSIYIGIPFCPTRCVYCSFPAYSLEKYQAWVEPFVAALQKEIQSVGQCVKELGLEVETIYIGGGTPTSLPVNKLGQILQEVEQWLKTPSTREYTVEAGRPDTLNLKMLSLLQAQGVTRLSINPQSMNPQTLKTIGRAHSPEEVIKAMELARGLGFGNINMDLIIGLPGEGRSEISQTLQQIKALAPENITVHTLAIKRASTLQEQRGNFDLAGAEVVAEMLELTYSAAREAGLRPYYLYRQKHMLGHLENVGFARPGFEGIYNIQMIEERQTIIGLGGGSGSKWVNPADWSLEATYNPKDPKNYFERVEELIGKKVERLAYLCNSD